MIPSPATLDPGPPTRTSAGPGLARMRSLLGELNDLKRIRSAGCAESLATQGFVRSWSALVQGLPTEQVAGFEAASAVTAARLGAIGPAVLLRAGLGASEVGQILHRALNAVADHLDAPTLAWLVDHLPGLPDYLARFALPTGLPGWVGRLAEQPRAGATRPRHPRLILEPPENHAEHCYLTALYAALAAPGLGASPTFPFLAGLAHHLHNAELPDSGFAGEELLGSALQPIMDRLTADALSELPAGLAEQVVEARRLLPHAETPEARAFHAGDVLDRVLQMEQYARVARFALKQALDDLDLVHPGPLQAHQLEILANAGLWP